MAANNAEISFATLQCFLDANRPYKVKTLEHLIGQLAYDPAHPDENPFPNGNVQELLNWYGAHGDQIKTNIANALAKAEADKADALAKKTQAKIDKVDALQARYALSRQLGTALRARRITLNLSAETIGEQTGLSHQRVYQLEDGLFSSEKNATFQRIVLTLGYPESTANSLLNDTPITPEWVKERNQHQAAQEEENAKREKENPAIATAIRSLRNAHNLSQSELARKAVIGDTVQWEIENAGDYSDKSLQATIRALGITTGDCADLLAHHERSNHKNSGKHQQKHTSMQLLSSAMLVLRSYLDINNDQLSAAMPMHLRLQVSILHRLENVTDKACYKISDSLVGILAGIHNASMKTPGGDRLFVNCPNLRSVARIANNPDHPIHYNTVFVSMLNCAVEELIHTAMDVEPDACERAFTSGNRNAIAHNRTKSPLLSEMMDDHVGARLSRAEIARHR